MDILLRMHKECIIIGVLFYANCWELWLLIINLQIFDWGQRLVFNKLNFYKTNANFTHTSGAVRRYGVSRGKCNERIRFQRGGSLTGASINRHASVSLRHTSLFYFFNYLRRQHTSFHLEPRGNDEALVPSTVRFPRDLENAVNCSETRRGTRLLLLFTDARNCNETVSRDEARFSLK